MNENIVKSEIKYNIVYEFKYFNFNNHLPGKFCNRLLTEILTEVPISHSLTEFKQPFNR